MMVPTFHLSNKPQTLSYTVKLFLKKVSASFFLYESTTKNFFLQFVTKLQFAGIIIIIIIIIINYLLLILQKSQLQARVSKWGEN
jgi:hypothetical protein